MIKVVIIDDEKHCIETLAHHLKKLESVEVVAVTQSSAHAKELIEQHQPDIVFLDIEMPTLTGFDLLMKFERIQFKVVFTTAFDQYAIRAFKLNALDYLLKPIALKEIELVLEKFRSNEIYNTTDQLSHLHQFMNGKMQDTIALSTMDGLQFIKIEEIMYLEGNNGYTNIIMHDKVKLLASKNLSTFEDVLGENPIFFRAHKSNIINLKYIKQYIRGEGGEIIMQDNSSIALSRNKKQEFLAMFKRI